MSEAVAVPEAHATSGTAVAAVAAPEAVAISLRDLTVTYRIAAEQVPTLKTTLLRLGRRQRVVRTIHALKGVTLDVPQGTVLAVIGNNGAGKSSLMRAVAGILAPTSGQVRVRGRVSALLSLGVGFNRELTGRDNVMLGGLAAGLSRDQVRAKYAEIVDFAELHDVMDLPMRTYSSGMYSRLAFAVAVSLDPDILLVDEALRTGDAYFKNKSFHKIKELCGQARTILIVSHGMATIKELCTDSVWLHQGSLMMRGPLDQVLPAYTRFADVGETPATMEDL